MLLAFGLLAAIKMTADDTASFNAPKPAVRGGPVRWLLVGAAYS